MKILFQGRLDDDDVAGSASQTGVRLDLDEPEIPWKAFERYTVKNAAASLYCQGKTPAAVLPRELFDSDEDWTAFCRLLKEQVRR